VEQLETPLQPRQHRPEIAVPRHRPLEERTTGPWTHPAARENYSNRGQSFLIENAHQHSAVSGMTTMLYSIKGLVNRKG
jgi:hypothetical protein